MNYEVRSYEGGYGLVVPSTKKDRKKLAKIISPSETCLIDEDGDAKMFDTLEEANKACAFVRDCHLKMRAFKTEAVGIYIEVKMTASGKYHHSVQFLKEINGVREWSEVVISLTLFQIDIEKALRYALETEEENLVEKVGNSLLVYFKGIFDLDADKLEARLENIWNEAYNSFEVEA